MAETTVLKPVNPSNITSQTREVGQSGQNMVDGFQSHPTKTYVIEIKGNIDLNSRTTTEASIARLAIMLADINEPGLTVGELGERVQTLNVGNENSKIKINITEGEFPIKDVENLTERHRFNPDQNTLYAFNIIQSTDRILEAGEQNAPNALVTQSVAREMVIIKSVPAIEAVVIVGTDDPKLTQPIIDPQAVVQEITAQAIAEVDANLSNPQPKSPDLSWMLNMRPEDIIK